MVINEEFDIPKYGVRCKLTVYESDRDLGEPEDPFTESGIVVKTSGAILDKGAFGYKKSLASKYIYGELYIEGLDELIRKDPTIVNPHRGGLNWSKSEFCQELERKVSEKLRRLIEEKTKALQKGRTRKLDAKEQEIAQKLCQELDRLYKEIWEEEELQYGDIELERKGLDLYKDFFIKPERANIPPDGKRVFKVYLRKDLVPGEGAFVEIEATNPEVVELNDNVLVLTEDKKHPEFMSATVEVKALGEEGDETHLFCAVVDTDIEASALIKIAQPTKSKRGTISRSLAKGGLFASIELRDEGESEYAPRAVWEEGVVYINIGHPLMRFYNVQKFSDFINSQLTPLLAEILFEVLASLVLERLVQRRVDSGMIVVSENDVAPLIQNFWREFYILQRKYLKKLHEIVKRFSI